MTAWLINPARKGSKKVAARKTKRKPPKGYRSWSAWSKAMQRRRKAKAGTSTRKTGGRKVAARKTARKRTTATRRRAPAKRRTTRRRTGGAIRLTPIRGRVYKRNPGGKIVKTLTDGVKNAAFAVLGKASARAIPDMLGLPRAGVTGIATQAAVAVGIGMVADKVLPKGAGPFVVAGALMGPIESLIVSANVPLLSSALSGDNFTVSARRSAGAVSGYARVGVGPMGGYARRLSGVGAQPTARPIITGPGVLAGYDYAANNNNALGGF